MKTKLLFLLFFIAALNFAQGQNLPLDVPTNGLLAYFPFNNDANDASGNGSNGIATELTPTSDRFGNSNSAFTFNGTSSNIEADVINYPLKGGSRTITGWFKASSPIVSQENDLCLLNYGNISDPNYWFKISLYRKGYLDIQFDAQTFSSQENYFNNNWTFFALTFDDGTNTYSLSINNVYKMGGTADLYTNGFGNLFRIGRNKLNNYFEGTIDDIGIWNRVLTPEEITGLFLLTIVPETPPPTVIISAETPTTFCAGDSVLLTSVISPIGTYVYTWMRDGVIIPNQTSANYTAVLSGNYSLKITNLNDSKLVATSNSVTIVVNETPPPTTDAQTFSTATVADLQVTGINAKWYTTETEVAALTQSTQLETAEYYVSQTINGCESTRTAVNITITQAPKPYTLIPDLNFENKLIALGIDSGTTDGKVLTSSISSLTSLDVSNSQIADLTGIQDFVSLKSLSCENNKLTTLDLTNNVALRSLDCSYNYGLISFDISKNIALTSLKSNGNSKLVTFDISKNLALTDLECNNINLTTLDVSLHTSLLTLICSNNQLTSLDVLKNTALNVLNFYSNQISTIDVSNNIALDTLSCESNKLVTLDLSKNVNLKRLNCSNNKLVSLNLKNGNNPNLEITNSISRFLYNADLACIQVDNKAYSDANWSNLKDATTNYSENCPPQNILISSEFEDKLIALGIDTDGKNGSVLSAEILNVKSIDVSNSGITDLSGIEYFMNLESLICKANSLTTIDLSSNTALKYLDCSNNPLTVLDVSKNILLTELYCDGVVTITNKINSAKTSSTPLTVLDLSNNLLLTKLSCSNNQLVSLDLSKNILLTDVNCSNNNLQNLNLSNSNYTKMLTVNFKNNSSLYCIKVDDTVYSNTNWTEAKDIKARYSEDCDAPLVLPSDNFIIESKGETCLNENNGEISITVQVNFNFNYVATINGTKYPIVNNSLTVSNLAPATYNVSISITGEIFEQNFAVTIPKGATITGKSTVSSRLASVEITEGTAPYKIFVNGKEQFETTSASFSVEVNKGDLLEVETAKACEGIYSKGIETDLLELVLAYPNPTSGKFEIEVPISTKEVVIDLYTMDSKIISKKTYTVTNGRVQLSLENQASGVYMAKIYLEKPEYLKIIKK